MSAPGEDGGVQRHVADVDAAGVPEAVAQPNQAWRLIGASSCFLKDRNGAEQAWNELDSQGRSFVTYVCKRNGLIP